MKYLFFLLMILVFSACEPERIYIETFIEVPADSVAVTAYVASNVTRTSNSTIGDVRYVTASGKITNRGPGYVYNVRIILTTDSGYSRTVSCNPSTLQENESGSWTLSSTQGSYIKYRDVLFRSGN